MKKKIIAGLLAAAMGMSMVACGGTDTAQENAETVTEQGAADADADTEEDNTDVTDTEAGSESGEDDAADEGNASVEDLGQALYESFLALDAANPDASTADIADGLLANDFILFSGATMAVEPGYLTGFGNAEITGFEEGTMFAPMIGSIPFVGYVFALPTDADVDAFKTVLTENADMNWNICTTADETVVESSGNRVFFVMCPTTLDGE
jgi:hypothetical protein